MNLIDTLSQFYQHNSNIINAIGINMLLGLSLYIALACGQLALSSPGFMSIGAYVSSVMTTQLHTPFALNVLVGMVVAMLIAFLLGRPVLRLHGVFLAIATIGFGEVVRVAMLNVDQLANTVAQWTGATLDKPIVITGGAVGLFNIPLYTRGWMIFLAVLLLAIFFQRLRTSRAGFAYVAIRENEEAAEALGINVFAYRIGSFVLSAAIAALAGALDAHTHSFISPNDPGYLFSNAVRILMMVVIGGTTLYMGTLLGATLITLLPQLLDGANRVLGGSPVLVWLKQFPDAFNGLLLLAVILLAPGGLGTLLDGFGTLWQRGWDTIRQLAHGSGIAGQLFSLLLWPDRLRQRLSDSWIGAGTAVALEISGSPRTALASSATSAASDVPLLALQGISRNFGGVQALHDISFQFPAGEIHGLIGPNGAGKTTLFNIISGLTAPSEGTIIFQNQLISTLPAYRVAELGITRTFQNIRLFPTMSVLENILVGQHRTYRENLAGHVIGWPAELRAARARQVQARALLALVGLSDSASLPAASLSYGDQRRLEIARALAAQPILLLLDEPAAGMNETETVRLQELLKVLLARGITILLVEHHMSLVMRICQRLTVLNFGEKLAEGSPAIISQDSRVIEAYLGHDDDRIS